MNKLILLGNGGHSKVIEEALKESKLVSEIAYLDDNQNIEINSSCKANKKILGNLNMIYNKELQKEFNYGFVSIGNPMIRLKWINELLNNGYKVPVIIHPRAWVSKSSILGNGSLVLSQSTVQAEVLCGKGTIINNCASIDHDSILKDGVHIAPGANIAGNVEIGEMSWIGIGASVIQGVKIGSHATIGANAAVINDIPPSVMAVGVPAKVIKQINA